MKRRVRAVLLCLDIFWLRQRTALVVLWWGVLIALGFEPAEVMKRGGSAEYR